MSTAVSYIFYTVAGFPPVLVFGNPKRKKQVVRLKSTLDFCFIGTAGRLVSPFLFFPVCRGFVGDQDLDGELGAASRSLLSNEETGKLAVRGSRVQPVVV